LAGIALVFAVPLIAASPASANTPSNWSRTYDGVEFGWTNDHAWAIASYATSITLGSGEIASLACNAVSDGGFGPICSYVVEQVLAPLLSGKPRLTNHGIWVAYYPSYPSGYVTKGTY